MKRTLCMLLCALMALTFAACGGDKEEPKTPEYTYEIAFLTPSAEISIDDEDRMEAAWNGVRQFAEENGKTYKYYEAETNDAKSQLARIEDAVKAGAKVVVAVGPEVSEAIAEAQKKHDDVNFIYLDGTLDQPAQNTVTVSFDALQAGFLAGYGAVIEGLDNLAYLANGESEEAVSYGYGFLQGANQASMNFGRYAVIQYDYGKNDATEDEIKDKAKTWYENGTEAVFTYGADVYNAVKEEAEEAEKAVIASNASKEYNKTVITSGKKCFEEAVAGQLKSIYDDKFKGGTAVKMNVKNQGVGLDMKESKFQYFNQDMYKEICKSIRDGEQKILSAKDAKTIDELVKAQWMYYIRIEEQ